MYFCMSNSIKDITAKELMTSTVLTAYEGWSIKRLADFFSKHKISGAPVIASDHKLVGVVSVSDLARFDSMSDEDKYRLVVDQVYTEYVGQHTLPSDVKRMVEQASNNCIVNSIMTPEVISVDGDLPLKDIAKLMNEHHIHRVFVTCEGRVDGVISTGNILKQIAELD